jgi:hypothetical protein
MLIDPQHAGALGLDFETRESNNASVARDHSPEVGQCSLIRLRMISVDATVRGAFPALPSHRNLMV